MSTCGSGAAEHSGSHVLHHTGVELRELAHLQQLLVGVLGLHSLQINTRQRVKSGF